jgi:hypothetical protein
LILALTGAGPSATGAADLRLNFLPLTLRYILAQLLHELRMVLHHLLGELLHLRVLRLLGRELAELNLFDVAQSQHKGDWLVNAATLPALVGLLAGLARLARLPCSTGLTADLLRSRGGAALRIGCLILTRTRAGLPVRRAGILVIRRLRAHSCARAPTLISFSVLGREHAC